MKSIIIPVVIIFCFGPVGGQDVANVSRAGTTSAPFLEIGVGARANGLGGAFVALADDANALYWNPSGIARLTRNEVSFVHTEWIADTQFEFAGIVFPLGASSAIGASVTVLNMGEMKVRTVFEPEGTGEMFGASDLAIGITYARSLTDKFSIGITTRYIQQSIWHMKASSVALDIGTLFTTEFNGMRIGMSISNFGNNMRLEGKDTRVYHDIDELKFGNNERINAFLETEAWSLPLTFRVGIAMDVINTSFNRLTVVADALHPNDNYESINLGTEYALNEAVFLRIGWKSLYLQDSEQGLTVGAGIHYNLVGRVGIKIDYAYADFGILNNAQRISVGIEY